MKGRSNACTAVAFARPSAAVLAETLAENAKIPQGSVLPIYNLNLDLR
jgi:hypothetical protein